MKRADRKLVVVVCPHGQRAGFRVEPELERTRLEFSTVLLAQEGDQQFALQVAAIRLPIDVEPACELRIRTPFKHVQPPRIVRTAHPHMVRDEIKDLAETVLPERGNHPLKG